MGAGVGMASELPLAHQLRKLVPGHLQVNLLDLRGEGIALAAIADVAGNLRISFQCGSDGLDLSLGLRR